jgi:hypothetical protein
MKGAGPHIPERGWERRWPLQALDLAFAAPAAMAVLIAGVFALGLLSTLAVSALPSRWTMVLVGALSAAAAVPVIVVVHGFLLQADGHGRQSISDLLRKSRSAMAPVFLVHSAMAAIFLRSHGVGTTPPAQDVIEAVFAAGMQSVLSAHVALTLINPLWIPLIPGFGFSLREAAFASTRMVAKMLPVWMTICLAISLVGNLALSMPAMVGVPLILLLVAWTYVAAREIFGGISQNGTLRDARVAA